MHQMCICITASHTNVDVLHRWFECHNKQYCTICHRWLQVYNLARTDTLQRKRQLKRQSMLVSARAACLLLGTFGGALAVHADLIIRRQVLSHYEQFVRQLLDIDMSAYRSLVQQGYVVAHVFFFLTCNMTACVAECLCFCCHNGNYLVARVKCQARDKVRQSQRAEKLRRTHFPVFFCVFFPAFSWTSVVQVHAYCSGWFCQSVHIGCRVFVCHIYLEAQVYRKCTAA